MHPLGQVELNAHPHRPAVRRLGEAQQLGVEIDDVAINAVYPPILVKSYFLDVTERGPTRSISSTRDWPTASYAVPRRRAKPEHTRRSDQLPTANGRIGPGRAESFTLIEQFRHEEQSGAGRTYVQARKMALTRRYYDTMRDVLKTVATKVLLNSGEPADLTIFTPTGRLPAAALPAGQAPQYRRTGATRRACRQRVGNAPGVVAPSG